MKNRLFLPFVLATVLLGTLVPADVAFSAATPTKAQGAGPYADILFWADTYKCEDLTRDALAAMIMVPTHTETGAEGASTAPSPMTLSRYDNQDALYGFGTKGAADRAFFHPGIGEWQWDSAGGWTLSAGTAIDTATAAKQAAITMSTRYCASTRTEPADKRAYAWAPWYYCQSDAKPTRCERGYAKMFDNGTLNVNSLAGITSTGGMEWRTCDIVGIGAVNCGYVDPAKAQGLKSFTAAGYGPAPLSAPFYVFEHGGKEHRFWLRSDTGYTASIRAFKNITTNARTGLTWQYSDALCDRTAGRGDCAVTWSPVVGTGGTATPGGRVAMGRNRDGRLEAWMVGTDGRLYKSYQMVVNGGWSGWQQFGGVFPAGTSPTVGRNADGRLEVFAVATDGAVWHAWQVKANGAWSLLYPMGSAGTSTGPPAVGTNVDGRQELFARGSDGQVWHTWQTSANAGWAAWSPLSGATLPIGGIPAVATNLDGRQQLVVIKSDGRLATMSQLAPNSPWNNFSNVGGGPYVASNNPTIGRNADGRLEIFLSGDIYGVVYHSWQASPGTAFGPFVAFNAASSARPTPVLDLSGRLNLFLVGPGGSLGVLRQIGPNGNWLPLVEIGGTAATSPASDLNADTRLDLYSTEPNGNVIKSFQLQRPT